MEAENIEFECPFCGCKHYKIKKDVDVGLNGGINHIEYAACNECESYSEVI
jgi:transcription elongation factor Elf1